MSGAIGVNCLDAVIDELLCVDTRLSSACLFALADESIILIALLQLLQTVSNLHFLFLDERQNIVEFVTAYQHPYLIFLLTTLVFIFWILA